jgi:Co/Zn/Cd efflux system component
MATHVLWQADVADFDAWLKVFREDTAMRQAAGIHDLHVWRDPDQKDHAVAMFEVDDIQKARAFFDSEELAMHLERGGVAHIQVKLLDPVLP